MIHLDRPPPGATAEERATVYADALLATEKVLNEFKDNLSEATEEILVLRNLLEKDREEFRQFRDERKRDREADKARRATEKTEREADKDSFERRFEHLENMLELVLRKLSIEAMIVLRSFLLINKRRTVAVTTEPLSSQLLGLQLRKPSFFNSRNSKTALSFRFSKGEVFGSPSGNNSQS